MSAEAKNEKVIFYVAQNGNDSWSGTLALPNDDKTDGPFATLKRAQQAVREVKGQSPVTVFIRDGVYFLDETLIMTPEDSGTDECPITYSAYKDEKPIISGGRAITGWRQVTVGEKKLWVADVAEAKNGKWFFRELWVNGERRKRSRYPNRGYLNVAGVTEKTEAWNQGQTSFQYKEGDIKQPEAIKDGEVVVMCRWVDSHLPIKDIDASNRLISFPYKSVFQLASGDPYYIEHTLEILDTPGEWYLDKNKGVLYYMPMPDEKIDKVEVIAPVLGQIMRLEGKPEADQYIENLTFRGLTFANSEWWLPEGVSGFAQAAVGVLGAIYGEGVRHCTWENCTIAHVGNYAIELSRGCQWNKMIYCKLFDLGAGGVKIGETRIRDNKAEQTFNNEIRDCQIHDGGIVFHPAVGVWIGQSPNNRIAYNHIHDFYYTGVSIGWTWGYGKALATGNILESNHIHHIGVKSDGDGPILSDMGGVYTLGLHEGSVVRHNIFHDIAGLRYGGWGIYFDEGTTHILAENNLVYRTTHGGFHQHYGKENIVRNNIFAFARDQQIQRSRPEEHSSFTFEKNIVYWDRGVLISGNLEGFNFTFDNNLYWQVDSKEIRVGSISWDIWREKGMDKNSLIADPLFVSPENDDFRLKPDSPAIQIGFVPFKF